MQKGGFVNSIMCNASFVKAIRLIFDESGISIAEWARAEGFSTALVYQVIEGKRRCMRGQSHRIAVLLGLKAGVISDIGQLKVRLAALASTSNEN